jgi:DNA-binding protein H-NS
VGKHIEVIPHYRRPHMALVWTGRGRAVPKIVPRRGSVVHREAVEKLPSGFGGIDQ